MREASSVTLEDRAGNSVPLQRVSGGGGAPKPYTKQEQGLH